MIVVDRVLISAAVWDLRATIEFSAGADDIALSVSDLVGVYVCPLNKALDVGSSSVQFALGVENVPALQFELLRSPLDDVIELSPK